MGCPEEVRGRQGTRMAPLGALGFHYAKPQMESCDRVSLRGRSPKARTMAPLARLLRCNVTQKLNSPIFSLAGCTRRVFSFADDDASRIPTMSSRIRHRRLETKSISPGVTLELFTRKHICDDDFYGFRLKNGSRAPSRISHWGY